MAAISSTVCIFYILQIKYFYPTQRFAAARHQAGIACALTRLLCKTGIKSIY